MNGFERYTKKDTATDISGRNGRGGPVARFGFVKLRYRGLKKNAHRLFVTCALVNRSICFSVGGNWC
jgi:hypothetical protein